jgi:hypothetical protein
VCGKITDLITIHADYLMKYKITDISLDITGTYIQMLLSEAGLKLSTIGVKLLIIALIAVL